MGNRFVMRGVVVLATMLSGAAVMAAGNSQSLAPLAMPLAMGWEPSPKIDGRGYIDIWALRSDVAHVESLYATDDTDQCSREGDPDEQLSPRQIRRMQSEEKACIKKINAAYKIYVEEHLKLNRAWGPVLRAAIRKGDAVAEVVMRQCETTAVLDRSDIESTCDEKPERRTVATRRLDKIGFLPATDNSGEIAPDWLNPNAKPNQHEVNQLAVLKKVRSGALGYDWMYVHGRGQLPSEPNLVANTRRWVLLEAIQQDVQRAFTYSNRVTGFGDLRLVRKPTTLGQLTMGQRFHSGGNDFYTGPYYWRWGTISEYFDHRGKIVVGGLGDARFIEEREALLAEIDASIDRYLKQEPRWSVFLLHRVGHHEWIPEGTQSTTHKLDPAWLGKWTLQKESVNWSSPMTNHEGTADIYQDGEFTRITVAAASSFDPFNNVSGCLLRYSGGSTYLPKITPDGKIDEMNTLLGYMLRHGPHPDAIAPFDVRKRYKQVLMQCAGAEEPDWPRARFLLLAGDTLIEFGYGTTWGSLAIRHYQRVKE